MEVKEIEAKLVKAYSQVFYELLMERISSNEGITDFENLPEKNKNDIGTQAGKKAITLAEGFVTEMKVSGYLQRKPTEAELSILFKRYMEKNVSHS
jgi:hypothetical protein